MKEIMAVIRPNMTNIVSVDHDSMGNAYGEDHADVLQKDHGRRNGRNRAV